MMSNRPEDGKEIPKDISDHMLVAQAVAADLEKSFAIAFMRVLGEVGERGALLCEQKGISNTIVDTTLISGACRSAASTLAFMLSGTADIAAGVLLGGSTTGAQILKTEGMSDEQYSIVTKPAEVLNGEIVDRFKESGLSEIFSLKIQVRRIAKKEANNEESDSNSS